MKSLFVTFFILFIAAVGFGQSGNDSPGQRTDSVKVQKPVVTQRRLTAAPLKISRTIKVDSPIAPVRNIKSPRKQSYPAVVKQNPISIFLESLLTKHSQTKREQGGIILSHDRSPSLFCLSQTDVFKIPAKYVYGIFQSLFKTKADKGAIITNTASFPVTQHPVCGYRRNLYRLLASLLPVCRKHGPILARSIFFCALIIIYLVKFVVLKFLGWVFNIEEATDMYIFIVFLVNKLLGIFLIPFLVLLAFSGAAFSGLVVTLSILTVIIAFAYRYIAAYSPIRKQINVSQIHFFFTFAVLK